MAKREQIVEMIRRRATEYGVDPDLAVRIAELESSLNPNARNRRSSAAGLYQLTEARRREIGAPAKRALSLDEQVDYGLKSLSQAAKYLEDRLERAPQPFEIYAAHFSGPMGSVKVLTADPSAPIDRVLSTKAVRANPDLRGKTAGQVLETWRGKLGDFAPKQATAPAPVKEPAPAELYPTSEPDWGAIGRSQLTAQGPRPEAEPQTEPVAMMASGGMVGDDESPFNQQLARMVEMARSDSDFARINEMLAGGPQKFKAGGEVKGFAAGGVAELPVLPSLPVLGQTLPPVNYATSKYFDPVNPFAAGQALNQRYGKAFQNEMQFGLPDMRQFGGRYAAELATEQGRRGFGRDVGWAQAEVGVPGGFYKAGDFGLLGGLSFSDPWTRANYADLFPRGNSYFIPDKVEADAHLYALHSPFAQTLTPEARSKLFDEMYYGARFVNQAEGVQGYRGEFGPEGVMRGLLDYKNTVQNSSAPRASYANPYYGARDVLVGMDVGRGGLTYDQAMGLSRALEFQNYLNSYRPFAESQMRELPGQIAEFQRKAEAEADPAWKAQWLKEAEAKQRDLVKAQEGLAQFQKVYEDYLAKTASINPAADLSSAELLRLLKAGAPVPAAAAPAPAQAEEKPPGKAMGGMVSKFEDGGEVKKERSAKEMLAEMEPTAEERERLSKPAFGVVPSSGKGRKQGPVSEALQSGQAQLAAAKGMTMLPQNLVGSGVDIATMLMRPFGYNVEKPVGGSEYLKEKSRAAGLAFQEPQDPTLRAFFQAGDIGSNLVNPAGATRSAVRGAEKTGEAAKALAQMAAQDPVVARTVERAIERVAPAARPMYAVRPPGGGVPALPETTPSSSNAISNMESWLAEGIEGAKRSAPSSEVADAIQNFWKTKATNYVTRQMGTPDDPIFKQIMSGSLTTPQLEKEFRGYMLEQTRVGKTKVNPATGEERFYPKFPEATEDLTRKYDVMTGITPMVVSTRPDLVSEGGQWLGGKADVLAAQKQEDLISKLVAAGVPIGQINVPRVNVAAPLASGSMGSTTFQSSGPKALLEGMQFQGPQKGGRQQSSEAIRRAVASEEPIYDIHLQSPLKDVLTPPYINEYLATLTPKEIAKTRFEDVVKNSAKYRLKQFERETLVQDIKSGRPVKEKFFAEGVSAPLLQVQEGPLAGFAWKRIENAESTVPEGAYVGHSVGGYAKGGAYGPEKHKLFNEGKYQVYTLRDNRNRPVTTVEVKMENEHSPVVTQIKGNGRATGNTAPVSYDTAVEQFFRDYLKPVKIEEHDNYLTPRLQNYKSLLAEERSRKATETHLRELYPDAD